MIKEKKTRRKEERGGTNKRRLAKALTLPMIIFSR